jgi:hypothetical protein
MDAHVRSNPLGLETGMAWNRNGIQSTLQSESAAANWPNNKAASLWLSEQEELHNI